jgi:hypothetical protein
MARSRPSGSGTRQRNRTKNHAESSSEVVGVGLFGVFGSGTHEGVPGVGVAETVDVSVKNDLVRAHVVALKDGGESVVLRVEALIGADVAEKVRRGLPARLDECDRGEELEREGQGVSSRVSQQRGQLWLQTEESPAWVSAIARGARESENLMISCCTFSSVRGVTVVDVGEKLFVRLLVAGGLRRGRGPWE